MKYINIILACLFAFTAISQDLHIYYDVHNDSMWYMKNGRVVKDLKVKRDKNVYFHLVEFNNYIYTAEFESKLHEIQPAGYGSERSGMKGLMPQLLKSFFPGGGMPFMNVPVFGTLMGAMSGLNAEGNARGLMEDVAQFKTSLETIQEKTEVMNQLILDINKREKSARILTGDIEYINNLCKTNAIAPSMIRQLVLDYFSDAFMLNQGQQFGINDIEAYNEKLLEIPALKSQLNKKFKEYSLEAEAIGTLVAKLKVTDHGIDELYPLLFKYEAERPQINALINAMELRLIASESDSSRITKVDDFAPYIHSYFIKYTELLNNDFSYVHHAKAESRFMMYTLNLYKREHLDLPDSVEYKPKAIKTIKLKIDTYGDFKMGTSFGLNGGFYGSKPQSFYVKNDVLNADDDDRFAPMISSYINLTYSVGASISPVISFGIGLPLKNTENTESIAFFFGPGAYLGKKQSIMISTGFMFSKVNRLTNGLKVGDTINLGDGIIPTDKKFDSGFYLGLAYRIGE